MKGGMMETKIRQAREMLSLLDSKGWESAEGIKFFRIQESLIELKRQMKIEC